MPLGLAHYSRDLIVEVGFYFVLELCDLSHILNSSLSLFCGWKKGLGLARHYGLRSVTGTGVPVHYA